MGQTKTPVRRCAGAGWGPANLGFARHTIAVSIKLVDVVADDRDGALNVRQAVTALAIAGMSPSVERAGDSYDAVAATINGLYKTELIKTRGPWRTIDQVEVATLEWADWFNHRRINSYCADTPPAE